MMYFLRGGAFLLFTVLILSLAGCAGGAAVSEDGTYRERLGIATRQDILREVEQTLVSRYNYRFDRRVTGTEDIRFITQWNVHSPLNDEQAQSVTQSRTRILVNARPQNRSGGGARTYTVIFRAEYEVQQGGSAEWAPAPMTPSRTEFIEEIANYLENQVTGGVRTY